jgi:hypothetical protein
MPYASVITHISAADAYIDWQAWWNMTDSLLNVTNLWAVLRKENLARVKYVI